MGSSTGPEAIDLVYVGLSTAEAVPLYHCCAGGSVLHLVAFSQTSIDLSPCEDFDVVSEVYNPSSMGLPTKSASASSVAALARSWGASALLLEAADYTRVRGAEQFMRSAASLNLAVGLRTPLMEGRRPWAPHFVVLDLFGNCVPELQVPGTALEEYLSWASSLGILVELHVYAKEPVAELFLGHAYITSRYSYPLHIHLLEHRGGGAVRDLYSRLRSINPYTYVHVPLYSEEITYCPRCGSPVAYREGGVLRDLELSEGIRCWKCGEPLPFRLVVAKKTPESLARILGGEVKWYDARAVSRL